ncbi:hypothetical protein AMST5_03950 [freshwater sediment metagenome]|jgi:hypothetical protein|uniref:Uncharacterized protein n=1 Tax=freshwater sediment metagenome TaxID=556182 RepID=A0AA48M301_9ZZZZ
MDAARNRRLTALLEDAEQSIAAHWERCQDSGVAGATPEATARVDACVRDYFEGLKALPPLAPEARIVEAISRVFDDLMRLDAETGGDLLEDAERDLLHPLILNAAEAAGLDPHKFPRREPGGKKLDFSVARAR